MLFQHVLLHQHALGAPLQVDLTQPFLQCWLLQMVSVSYGLGQVPAWGKPSLCSWYLSCGWLRNLVILYNYDFPGMFLDRSSWSVLMSCFYSCYIWSPALISALTMPQCQCMCMISITNISLSNDDSWKKKLMWHLIKTGAHGLKKLYNGKTFPIYGIYLPVYLST